MIKIGYQGEIGSNNEIAAKKFVKENGWDDSEVELIPLLQSKYVVADLKAKKIDYAIMAARNSITGAVKESYEAVKDEYLEFVETIIIPIHHCVFISKESKIENIKYIASHIQALKQTKKTREKLFPILEEVETTDTAISAINLSNGVLPKDHAVICTKNAGLQNGLKLVKENIEDDWSNKTEFRVYKIPELDYSEENKPNFGQRISYFFANDTGASYITNIIIIAGLILIGWLVKFYNGDAIDIATSYGGYIAAAILFFTSSSFRSKRRYKSLIGYWKYYPISNKNSDKEQKFSTPRIVKISDEDDELKLEGVICDKENVPMFQSKMGEVFVSEIGKNNGGLVYTYESPYASQRKKVEGIAYISWHNKYASAPINVMKGKYFGTATGDTGTLTYLRITKEEYERHRTSTFL